MGAMKIGNVVIMLGVLPQMALNIWAQFIGKFITGFGVVVVLVTITVYVAETIPGQLIGKCLTSFNLGISSGFVINSIIQGVSLPSPDDASFYTTGNWRIGFCAAIPASLINLAQLQFIMKYESIQYCIAQNREEEALAQIKQVYKFEQEDSSVKFKDELVTMAEANAKNNTAPEPSMSEIFTEKMYRKGTEVAIMIAVLFYAGGIPVIPIVSNAIFSKTDVSVGLAVQLCSVASLIGACISPFII